MNAEGMRRKAKHRARSLVDRTLSPYFDRQAALIQDLQVQVNSARGQLQDHLPLELRDFNSLLHTLRTVELARMPRADRVLLSVGCSDASYFTWLEASHGAVPEHWGVELYRPQPEDLPDNVTWHVASASHMPAIRDGSVDVAFSGQNIEHLPAPEIVGFLTEVHRVLRAEGVLVLDSPNRLITEPTTWRHPEHVIELSPAEAIELVTLAGFEVTTCRGYWLNAELDGSVLPLMPEPSNGAEFLRRTVLAADRPECSFCWWLEARKKGGAADTEALSAHVAGLYDRLWPKRVNRGAFSPGVRTDDGFVIQPGSVGMVYRVGPFPFFQGRVSARVTGRDCEGLLVQMLAEEAGNVVAEGCGTAELATTQTMFGAWIEVHAMEVTDREIVVGGIELTN